MDTSENSRQNNRTQANSLVDLCAFVMDILITYSQEFARGSSQTIRRFLDNLQITELVDAVGDKLAEEPVLGFAVLAMALSCAVPVVVFIIFAIISVIFTFAGFIFVEGTLLTVGCLCLFGCLISMILVMSFMAVILGVLYFAIRKIARLINNCERTKAFINNMVPLLTGNEENFEISSTSVADAHQD